MTDPYHINLQRIDPEASGDKLGEVLIIWFATNPFSKGQVIVGWYRNATVFKAIQRDHRFTQRAGYNYNVIAHASEAILLPIDKRRYLIGHGKGKPGTANVFYVYETDLAKKDLSDKRNAWISEAIAYVEGYRGSNISTFEDGMSDEVENLNTFKGGQGFLQDTKIRMAIENYAMSVCRNNYKSDYKIKDVSKTHSYDFHLRPKKNGEEIMVEVKGTHGSADRIILTKNEVELSRKSGGKMALFIVHSIQLDEKGVVKKRSGKKRIIDPWKAVDERLTPISYLYKLDDVDDS